MSRDINVTSSYTTGLTINVGTVEMNSLLGSIAINVIVQCQQMNTVKGALGRLESTSNVKNVDYLVDEYFDGVHGAVLTNLLVGNVKILHAFMQDCVLNQTIAGLYLMRGHKRNGQPLYKLIPYAVNWFMKHTKKEYSILGEEIPYDFPKYDEYNERFLALFE